jgi:membrane-associated phospholipid phosphatase
LRTFLSRSQLGRDGWSPALSPPFTLVTGLAASSVVALAAALVWHTRWPDAADAEVMRWQEAASVWGDGIATAIAYAVGPLVGMTGLGVAALGWRARRWDAVVLAVVTAPATLLVEQLLKEVVHRQRPDGGALLYPSGHVAAVTAAAVTAVLMLRVTLVRPRTRRCVAWLAGGFVLVVAGARLVQTVHFVTDVVGGAALGVAVTSWTALAITAGVRFACVWRLDRAFPGRGRDPAGYD